LWRRPLTHDRPDPTGVTVRLTGLQRCDLVRLGSWVRPRLSNPTCHEAVNSILNCETRRSA
jgi:hypothetical protein